MFGSQSVKGQAEVKPGPIFDPKTIPVHTMQDDLDGFNGKIKISPVDPKEAYRAKPFNEHQKPASNVSPLTASSPFMESPAPTSPFKNTGIQNAPKVSNSETDASKSPMRASDLGGSTSIPVGTSKIPTDFSKEIPETSGFGKLTWALIGILVLLVGGGGGYYFYMTRYNIPALEEEIAPAEELPEITPEVVTPEKFSADKPNYLLLDVETISAEEIQKLLIQKAEEIRADKKNAPIEFVITDSNNNPIALKIFARLMKITFSPALLDNFRDEFSVYVFPDGNEARLGLDIVPADAVKAMVDMKAEEKGLVKNLGSLLLGEVAKSQTSSFQDAVYKDNAIRYINLDDQKSLSIDYFSLEDHLVVATSKNAAWAIIDKMTQKKGQ